MTRFMDELHGSVGERCIVAGYGDTHGCEGTIEALHDVGEAVDVRYDNGTLVRVRLPFVTLVLDEDEADA